MGRQLGLQASSWAPSGDTLAGPFLAPLRLRATCTSFAAVHHVATVTAIPFASPLRMVNAQHPSSHMKKQKHPDLGLEGSL